MAFVVNPVFQNWCQEYANMNQRALVASRVKNRHFNNWSLSDEQPNTSGVNVKSAGMFSRVVALLLIAVCTCLVSILALVLTIMTLFGKIGLYLLMNGFYKMAGKYLLRS